MTFRVLDLFCGGGGSAAGLHRAGLEVVGVDIEPQPHYPFEFHLADAMTFPLGGYDAYWASPPCQRHTLAGRQWRKAGRRYPDLIAPMRLRLLATGKFYILENVLGAPLINPIMLNGPMFGLSVRRTRLFEANFPLPFVLLPREPKSHFRMGRPVIAGNMITPVGHFSNVAYARQVMGISWMTQKELAQAIPPVYAEFLGQALLRALAMAAKEAIDG